MFYNARWYDPVLAHFTSADTLIPQPGNSGDWNRYAYVLYNPANFNDPSGHDYSGDDEYDPSANPHIEKPAYWESIRQGLPYYLDYVEVYSERVSSYYVVDHRTEAPSDTSVWYSSVYNYQAQTMDSVVVDLPFKVAAVELILELSLQAIQNYSYNRWRREAPDDFIVFSVNIVCPENNTQEFAGFLVLNLSNVPISISLDSSAIEMYKDIEVAMPANQEFYSAILVPGSNSGAFISNSVMGIDPNALYGHVWMNYRTPMFIDAFFRWGMIHNARLSPKSGFPSVPK
jgi:hypothetical protein